MSLGYYFDMTRCVGCRACELACKDKNRLDVGTIFRNTKTYTVGKYPATKLYSFSASCNHCGNPACIAVCPTGAVFRAEDGAVIIDQGLCIADQSCVKACPYGIPQVMPTGNAGKCDSCYAIRHAGGQPACISACPDRALDFGDTEDLKKKYGPNLVNEIAVLPGAATTLPSTLIKAKEIAKSAEFIELKW